MEHKLHKDNDFILPHNPEEELLISKDTYGGSYIEPMSLDNFFDLVGVKWYHIRFLLILGTIAISEGAQILIITLSMTLTQHYWGFSDAISTLIVTFNFVGVVIGSAIAGHFADKYGRRRPMVISAILMMILNLLSAFSFHIIMFAVIRIAVGIALGFFAPLGFTSAVENVPKEIRGKIVMLANACMFIGQLVACLIAFFTVDNLVTGNWRALIIASTIPFVLSAYLIYCYLDESLRYLLVLGKFDEAFVLIDKILRVNNDSNLLSLTEEQKASLQAWEHGLEEDEADTDIASVKALFKGEYKRVTIIVWFGWFANFFVYYGLIVFLPITLVKFGQDSEESDPSKSGDLSRIALSILAESISVVIAYLAISIKILNRKLSLMVFFLLAAASLLVMAFQIPENIFVLFATISKILINICTYYYYLLTLELYPTKYRATGLGVAIAFGKVATVLMPFTGFGLARIYFLAPFVLFALLCGGATFSLTKLPGNMEEKEIK